jgi:hypothetical protein
MELLRNQAYVIAKAARRAARIETRKWRKLDEQYRKAAKELGLDSTSPKG